MTVNEELINTIRALGLDCQQSEYTGKNDKYVVFDYEDEQPLLVADNSTEYDRVFIQLNLITPKGFNYLKLKDKIKNTLESQDWYISGCSSFLGDVYSETTKIRTTVFNIQKAVYRSKED